MVDTLYNEIQKLNGYIEAEIFFIMNHPNMTNKVLIVVEGEDDKKFYSCCFIDNQIEMYSPGGCGGFEEIAKLINMRYPNKGILIKDADFDNLNQKKYHYDNLFLTDMHDWEMMAMDDDFEKRINTEYVDGEQKVKKEDIEKDIIHISFIKWMNNIREYGLVVDVLKPVNGLYDGIDTVSIKDCLSRLYSAAANNEKTLITEEDIIDFERNHVTSDYANLTNGHDMCEGICRRLYACKMYNKKGKTTTADEMERLLRMTYSPLKFSRTKLYRSIMEWEKKTDKHILRD